MDFIKHKKEKSMRFGLLLLLIILYKLSLDFIYFNIITDYYKHMGFIIDIDTPIYIFTWGILLISIFPLKKLFERFDKPSAIIMVIFYLIYFYPNMTFNAISGKSSFFVFSLSYWFVLTLLYFITPVSFGKKIKRKIKPYRFYLILFSVLFITLAFTIYYNGLKIKFDLSDIYDIRNKVKEMDLPGIVGYLKPLANKFVVIGLIYFLIKKNSLMSGIMVIISLMLFAFGAHKTDFFLLILSFVIYLFFNIRYKFLILYGLIFLNCIVMILYYYNNIPFLIGIISKIHVRTIFTPNLISYFYFDYYSSNDFLFLSEHIFHWIGIDNPNKLKSPYLIAGEYFGNKSMSSNTGLIGNDFSQFGWASLLIFPFLRVYLLKVLDNVSSGLDIRIVILLSLSLALMYINSAFLTTFMTGGYILICILLSVIPKSLKD